MKTMLIRPARALCEWAASRGFDEVELLGVLGVSAEALVEPDGRVGAERFFDAIEWLDARMESEGEPLGFRLTEQWSVELFDVLGYLFYTSATMGEAFARVLEFKELWSEAEESWVERDGELASIYWRVVGRPRRAHEVLTNMAFSDIVGGGGRLMGRALPVVRVEVPTQDEGVLAAYASLAPGAKVSGGASCLRIVIEAQALDWPMPASDAILNAYFEKAAKANHQPARTLSERVREHVGARLTGSVPDVNEVAAAMGMSARTLQRGLGDEGSTYSELLERVRERMAKRHLEAGLSVAEVAWLCGFSGARAFHRAFKRWTGLTPGSYRDRG